MIKIYKDGEALDVYAQEVSFHSDNMRFGNSIADAYSTDVELPRNARNTRLLDVCGLLDRGQVFGTRVPVTVDLGRGGVIEDGYIRVSEVHEDSITAVVYTSRIPNDALDQSLGELMGGANETIMQWGFPYGLYNYGSQYTPPTTDVNIGCYQFEQGDNFGAVAFHPSVQVDWLLGQIGTRLGITIAPTNLKQRLMVSGAKISPYNPKQAVKFVYSSNRTDCKWYANMGAHPVNVWEPDDTIVTRGHLVFNRACHMTATFYWGGSTASGAVTIVLLSSSDSTISSFTLDYETTMHSISINVDPNNNSRVAKIRVYNNRTQDADPSVLMLANYTNYDIEDSDYQIDNNRVPKIPSAQSTTYYLWSYAYLPIFQNLPNITLRQLLTSLCWANNKKAYFSGDGITWVSATTKFVTAKITDYAPISDLMGRKSFVRWAEGSTLPDLEIDVNNTFLDAEKTVFQSSLFGTSTAAHGADIPLYDPTESLNADTFAPKQLKGPALCKLDSNNNLVGCDQMNTMGLEGIDKMLEITAWTFDDITDADLVVIEGHKFALVDYDFDADTGIYNFHALQLTT